MSKTERKRDVFADIATRQSAAQRDQLVEPQPPALPKRELPAGRSNPRAAFKPAAKLDTPEKLQRALERERQRMMPFLRNLAPPAASGRIATPITAFDWRLQVNADLVDFAGTLSGHGDWTRVRVPHYGGPLGRATAYYRAAFKVTRAMRALGAVFVCFKGVDYKAQVFVNGACLGAHEGMFAPFEFDCTAVVRTGNNTLLVKVENDAIHMGNDWGPDKDLYEGDKLCAAEGPGYDDPEVGWHVTPPGMGIVQAVTIEARRPIFVRDIFVRPVIEEQRAEAWIELHSCHALRRDVQVRLSVFGQNFRQTVCVGRECPLPGPLGPGVNYLRVSFNIRNPRLWAPDAPWLYQAQVTALDADSQPLDVVTRQFGMRSFHMDEAGEPKGRLYLNGREVRLRGANVSGSIQQCVMRGESDRLRDDILLAKMAHLNFLRIIQRPVQAEVYDMCDQLGVLTQTDLPLFGVLRRNQFCEAVRQAEEMERLVRSHPCNILVSYINEPFGGAMGKPHRHLLRNELEGFFRAADEAVRLANPDRVVKAADGDYDPPGPGQPDNHCYCIWYNGHGVDLGKLHRGYWQPVKPGWLYACGEFGAEGLDSVELMRKHCPPHWLPQTSAEEAQWTPNRIPSQTQTGRFHYLWFDTPRTLRDWVAVSRSHQAWGLRLMVEAFRRDCRMNSFAIYYLIDSWPTGWMKSIIDYDRQPKPAYFACREALTPLMTSIRTDRTAFRAGEAMRFECWICNDTPVIPAGARLRYQLEVGGKVVFAQQTMARVEACTSTFQGFLTLPAPAVTARMRATLRLALADHDGKILHDTDVELTLFPVAPAGRDEVRVTVIGARNGKAARLAQELGMKPVFPGTRTMTPASSPLILIDDTRRFAARRKALEAAVRDGATAIFVELPAGELDVAGEMINIEGCGMGARHFVSRDTGHPLVAGFEPRDFRLWFDPAMDRIAPLLETCFRAEGWTPILTTGNSGWSGEWGPALAVAEKRDGAGLWRICQVVLAGRTTMNPVAEHFAWRIMKEL